MGMGAGVGVGVRVGVGVGVRLLGCGCWPLRGARVRVLGRARTCRLDEIDAVFAADSVESIVASLEEKSIGGGEPEGGGGGDKWRAAALQAIKKASPTSLKLTLASIRQGRTEGLAECLRREFRMSVRCVEGQLSRDFYEGVRALLVDKDNSPTWDPASLAEVTDASVARFMAPLPQPEDELQLAAIDGSDARGAPRSRL
eukprot:jgi/Mesen1/5549/ME000280S04679